jgi:acyl-CoA thioester hydrolase
MARIQFELPEHFAFRTDIPLRPVHINHAGHLDNAQLVVLVSEARTRFYKSLGYQDIDVQGAVALVGDQLIQYVSEGMPGEVLRVEFQPQEFNRYGFDLAFRVSEVQARREIARGKIGVVFVGRSSGKVTEVPAVFLARLQPTLGSQG